MVSNCCCLSVIPSRFCFWRLYVDYVGTLRLTRFISDSPLGEVYGDTFLFVLSAVVRALRYHVISRQVWTTSTENADETSHVRREREPIITLLSNAISYKRKERDISFRSGEIDSTAGPREASPLGALEYEVNIIYQLYSDKTNLEFRCIPIFVLADEHYVPRRNAMMLSSFEAQSAKSCHRDLGHRRTLSRRTSILETFQAGGKNVKLL